MRILFVNTYYYPNMFGGAEHSVKLLAEGLGAHNECAVFSADAASKGLHEELVDGVKIYRSGSFFFDFKKRFSKTESRFCKLKNRAADLYNPAVNRHFRTVLDEFKPNVIHTNGLRGIGPKVWKIANERGIKVVHTLRDYFAADPLMREQPPSSMMISAWKNYWNRHSKYIDAVTAPSAFVIEKMQKCGFAETAKSFAIPNGIPFDKKILSENICNAQQKQNTKTRFLFAGSLVDFKGVLKLLEAFKGVRDVRQDVELIFCGAGPLAKEIQSAAELDRSIIYRGKIGAKYMAKEYQDADVCVIPSLWEEPFGRVVIEAAYNGCALIASNKGGIPEIIKNLNAGILCDCSDVSDLTSKMLALCDKERRTEQQKTFLNTVEKYSTENCNNQFDCLYAEILNG